MSAYGLIGQLLLLAVAAILGAYYLVKKMVRKFDEAGVRYITPIPVFGNLFPIIFRRKTGPQMIEELYNMEPESKYVGMFNLGVPTILLRDVNLIKTVAVKNFDHFPNHNVVLALETEPLLSRNLFTLEDDRWKHVRNVLTPAFTTSKMKSMFTLMLECAEDFTDSLVTAVDGGVMDMKDVFTRYTNDVIATCAFGISVNSMKNRDNEFFVIGQKSNFLAGKAMLKLFALNLLPSLSKMIGLKVLDREVETFFKDIIKTTIRVRDEKGIYRPDLIQLLMETRGKLGEGKELSIDDMTAQAFVFFFGGFESTSTCMCFTAQVLATHPEVYSRLREEVDRVMMETNGKLTYEVVTKMEYLDAIINEVLRLYPLSFGLDRRCSKPFELPPSMPGRKPYVIEKGEAIEIPAIALHRDPKYFEDPLTFNPDRFLDKEKNLVSHPAYMPFGQGPRMCIGNRLALLETKILFCHLVSKLNFEVCEKTVIPIKFSASTGTLSVEGGFWLNVSKREPDSMLPPLRSCIDTRWVDPNFVNKLQEVHSETDS